MDLGGDARLWPRLLLDLHNVHANSLNLDFDQVEYLERLDPEHIGAIHLAGGSSATDAFRRRHLLWQLDRARAALAEEGRGLGAHLGGTR